MIGGLLAGYLTDFLANKVTIKKELLSIYQLIVVPLVSILIVGLAMVFHCRTADFLVIGYIDELVE